jgi:uncharacterized coiled-coil protein SlyX
MTTSPELDQRLTRLENDSAATYELLTGIRYTLDNHGAWIKQLSRRQLEHSATLAKHSAKLDEHSAKLDEHSAKLDEHSAMHASHNAKLDRILEILERRNP